MQKTEPPPPKLSTTSLSCRICYDGDKDESLIAPCNCKGSLAFVHRTCLQRWLSESNTIQCELCQEVYQTESTQTPHGLCGWNSDFRRGFRTDVILCTAITPVVIILTYFCFFSSESILVTRWAVLLLLLMISVILIGYYVWVCLVIRMHSRMWLNWGRREVAVRYVASNEGRNGQVGDEGEVSVEVPENNETFETEGNENKEINV